MTFHGQIYNPKKTILNKAERIRLGRTMMELRGRGLTYKAIAVVLDLYEGIELTEYQVNEWCRFLGAPVNPNKVRARYIQSGLEVPPEYRKDEDDAS